MGMSKLPLLQLISPFKIGCIRGSLDIPLQSLGAGAGARKRRHGGKLRSPQGPGGQSEASTGAGDQSEASTGSRDLRQLIRGKETDNSKEVSANKRRKYP